MRQTMVASIIPGVPRSTSTQAIERAPAQTAPTTTLAETVVNDDLRYVEWREWNDSRPAALGKPAFAKIMSSGKLFARKFDVEEDAEILDLIDAALEG